VLISTFLVCKRWQALIYNYPLLWGRVIDYKKGLWLTCWLLSKQDQEKRHDHAMFVVVRKPLQLTSRSKETTTMIGQAQINA